MNKWSFLPLLGGLWVLPACETQEDLQTEVQMLIDQRVDNRVTTFTSTLRDNCQEKVLEEATRIVDSIIISEARLKTDTIAKPFRPDRPDIPEVKKLKDTLPVAPLFPDSLPIDVDSFPPVKKNEG